jgi:hypothetical protein
MNSSPRRLHRDRQTWRRPGGWLLGPTKDIIDNELIENHIIGGPREWVGSLLGVVE